MNDPDGFSLLEVIIATSILASSTVLLLSLFSTGQRHADRAEVRVIAQMLCQSKLDELLAGRSEIRAVEDEPLAGYPDWTYSTAWTPTDIEGLARLRVAVRKVDERDEFELVRWTRSEPGAGFSSASASERFARPSSP